jgi:MOSC domain-containing protein YiiM
MSKVFKLGITEINNQEIKNVDFIEVQKNKGIIGDRHYDEFNDPYCQLSLIESENIDDYNIKHSLNIPYIDFRRNIITKGIKLNNLVGKKLQIGEVKVEVIDLCRPCKHLSEILNQDNIIKEFLRKGGLRCQILSSSRIFVGDQIKIID